MPRYRIFAMILSSLLLISCAGNQPAPENAAQTQATPQPAKMTLAPAPDNHPGDDVMELWGEKVPDPYRWLEDASQEGVKAWMKAQDTRARDYLAQMPTRAQFEKRLSELLYVASISIPNVKNKWMFYSERGPKDEKSTYYVRDLSNPDAAPRVLIDPNKLSDDGSISFGGSSASHDGSLMAYRLKENNADQATLYIMNVETGEILSDKIEGARYAYPAWSKDNSGFYYTYFPLDPEIPVDMRPGMTDIRYHKVGTPVSEDKIIIEPLKDPTKFHQIGISSDGEWLDYTIEEGWNGTKIKFKRANSDGEWFELPTKKDTLYYNVIYNNTAYILTNDSASRFRMVKIDMSADKPDLSESAWQTLIPEFEDRVIENFSIVQDKLFVVTIKDVVNQLDVYDLNGKWLQSIELPDKGTISGLSGRPESESLYFGFTSYKIPHNIYKLDPKTLEMSPWAEVKTSAHTEDIISEQLFATSKDGTKIPMFVLRHKDTKLDGTAKTIIYGYGGFNVAITPTFSATFYAWLEQGGIYVRSNLRGGSEYGETWHQNGMGFKKQNVFDDYYAVAEHLIANKYTRSSSLAAYGGSNGGLLTGAAMTQRPDLYGAIVCAVPLLDMLRYHLYGSGRTWISEYGNAEASEEEFKNIRAYTPYSNVKKTAYPNVLFLGADSDDRVDPMHARKMTAAIQDATTSDKPVLLRIEKNSGHGGADMVNQSIAQFADVFSFLMEVLE
ncbi:MAG: S9 family peptidase [Proteobacteria bacterium]|nr:S9 family peptidase [Pseudomonadota bacterium]